MDNFYSAIFYELLLYFSCFTITSCVCFNISDGTNECNGQLILKCGVHNFRSFNCSQDRKCHGFCSYSVCVNSPWISLDRDGDCQKMKFSHEEFEIKIILENDKSSMNLWRNADRKIRQDNYRVEVTAIKGEDNYYDPTVVLGPLLSISMVKNDESEISLPIEFSLPLVLNWSQASVWSFRMTPVQSVVVQLPIKQLKNNIWKFRFILRTKYQNFPGMTTFTVKTCSLRMDDSLICNDILSKNVPMKSNDASLTSFDLTLPYIVMAQKKVLNMTLMVENEEDVEIEVTMEVMEVSCAFWNETESQWDGNDCWAVKAADSTSMLGTKSKGGLKILENVSLTCRCSHLSVFTGIVRSRPVPINFTNSIERILTAETKHHTIFTFIVMWLTYCVLVIWAMLKGRKDEYRARPIDLADNSPYALKMYILMVYTGKMPMAGTHAQVFVQFVGVKRKSDPHRLTCSRFRVLRRSQRNNFIIRTLTDLGDLTHLRIWVCGIQDCWYLRYIEVLDMQSMKMFHFICESWLSRDLVSYKTIGAAKYHDLYGFKPLMAYNVCRVFEDWHNWISVFYMPVGDNFTRVQRLSRSFCLLLGNLMCTLMFFGSPKYRYEIFGFGNIRITYNNITIAIYNSMLLGPLITVIGMLFRYSKQGVPSELVIPDWREDDKGKSFISWISKKSMVSVNTPDKDKQTQDRSQTELNSKLFPDGKPMRDSALNTILDPEVKSKPKQDIKRWSSLKLDTFQRSKINKNVSGNLNRNAKPNLDADPVLGPKDIDNSERMISDSDTVVGEVSVINVPIDKAMSRGRFGGVLAKLFRRAGDTSNVGKSYQRSRTPTFDDLQLEESRKSKKRAKVQFWNANEIVTLDTTQELQSSFELENEEIVAFDKLKKSKTFHHMPLKVLFQRNKNKKSPNIEQGLYEDPYDTYYGVWGWYTAWFLTIAMSILFTIIVSFYTIILPWPSYKRWVIASTTSFLLFLFVKDPATVVFLAFVYSSIFKERMICGITHVDDIKAETLSKIRTITRKEHDIIKVRRLHEFYKPNKWSEIYQQKLIKRLEWDGGLRHFIYETVFYVAFVCVFLTLSLLLLNPQLLYSNLHFEKLLSRNSDMNLREGYWIWMRESLIPHTYMTGTDVPTLESLYDTNTDPVVIRPPCLHTVKQDLELWDFFLDHFGLFDSSTVCFTSHREHSLQTINQLMNFHYLNSKYQGIGCSMFLYCLSNDFLVNIFSSLRLPDGGGVVFAFKVTSVQLYLTESSDFALISIVFLLSAILSMLHIFHKMALLGFGNYFCNLWNNVLLMMIMACLGMAITWWVFIQQWFESRKRIVSNEDFQFHEFYQMNQLLSFPSTILLILYSWRLIYTICILEHFSRFFSIVGQSILTFIILSFYLLIALGTIKAIGIIRPSSRSTLSFAAQIVIQFAGDRMIVQGPNPVIMHLVMFLYLILWFKLNFLKCYCLCVVFRNYKEIKHLPPDISSRKRYTIYMLNWMTKFHKERHDVRKEFILTETRKVLKQKQIQKRTKASSLFIRKKDYW